MFTKLYNWTSGWIGTIVIVFLLVFFLAQPFVIPSGSMKNSLLVGDFLFAKKYSYGIPIPRTPGVLGLPSIQLFPDFNNNGHLIEGKRPKRGDIVVFLYPKDPSIHYVKRNVAVEGDIVAMKDKNLLLHLNKGNDYIKANYSKNEYISFDDKLWLVNPYKKKYKGIHIDSNIVNNGENLKQLFDMYPVKIKKDEFFMLGDNRDHSNDSRFWGTVPYENIVGQPWFTYFSWDDNYEVRWERVLKSVKDL